MSAEKGYKPQGQGMKHHPAHNMFLITICLLALMIVFGFIAVFVPWVMKDLAVSTRAFAYPFKTCIEDTFSQTNAESCQDNDFINPAGVPLTGGDSTCKAFILATIAFVFISVIGGVLTLLAYIAVLVLVWSRPKGLATVAWICLVIVCISCYIAWIMFICYAERTCAAGSIFPVQGYSYGFILYLFASALSTAAVVTGYMALSALKNFNPEEQTSDAEEVEITYPEYPEVAGAGAPQNSVNASFV